MEEIVKILMRRDNMSREGAIQFLDEFREMLYEEIDHGASLQELEDMIALELGLEPDYLDYFIM